MEKIEFYFDKFLSQKIEKEIKFLFISHIVYMEELLNSGKITQEEYQLKRKQTLDSGNSAIRNINEQIESIFSNLKLN
jgi:hypothetical protein